MLFSRTNTVSCKIVFLIPGVNQFIPFVWGLLALLIAVFIHEMMHSVLARVEDVKVHSVGLLVALFPIGGFAKIDDKQLYGDELDQLNDAEEPDSFNGMTATIEEIRAYEKAQQEELIRAEEVRSELKGKSSEKARAATKMQRSRILVAGVMSNFCVAFVAALIFFFVASRSLPL